MWDFGFWCRDSSVWPTDHTSYRQACICMYLHVHVQQTYCKLHNKCKQCLCEPSCLKVSAALISQSLYESCAINNVHRYMIHTHTHWVEVIKLLCIFHHLSLHLTLMHCFSEAAHLLLWQLSCSSALSATAPFPTSHPLCPFTINHSPPTLHLHHSPPPAASFSHFTSWAAWEGASLPTALHGNEHVHYVSDTSIIFWVWYFSVMFPFLVQSESAIILFIYGCS